MVLRTKMIKNPCKFQIYLTLFFFTFKKCKKFNKSRSMRIKQTAIALKTTIGAKETSMKDELLKQLHEQYAVNNNSSMGAIVSFIVGMFTAFGGYGYVWINTNFCPRGEKNYCVQVLTVVAIIVLFLLLIMSYICMYQGTSQ